MTPMLWGAVILVVAAVAMANATKIIAWLDATKQQAKPVVQPVVVPSSETDAKVQRLVKLLDLIKELDAVGAKSAASKLKAAASTLIDEDFLA